MPPQDALEAIFEQIALIYVKLCEVSDIQLSISMNSLLLGTNGNFVNQSVAFNNLDTDPNPDIQAIISTQITNFNGYITALLAAKRALLLPAQQGFSDCRVLKICSKSNTINGLWGGVQNVAATPAETSANLASAIAAIKAIFDADNTANSLLKITTGADLIASNGNFAGQTLTFDNLNTDANSEIESAISTQVSNFESYIVALIIEKRALLPVDQQNGSDCAILNVCDKTDTINAIWVSFQNLAAKPQDLSVLVAKAIVDIKLIFDEVEENDPIIPFEAPILWTDKGRLNIDPNSFPFVFENPDSDPEIDAIQTNVNDVFGDLIAALNKAVGNTSDPVS
jgi:hypothetical protein